MFQAQQVRQVQINKGERMNCYTDHNEDIRTKGDCDYCGSTEKEGKKSDETDLLINNVLVVRSSQKRLGK